jgi:hypothetical protein
MAIAWPDRIVKLVSGDPVCFESSCSGEVGILSRLSCGAWEKHDKAIVAMMDRGYAFLKGKFQEFPMANFLIEMPERIPSNKVAEIAPTMAIMRDEFNEKEAFCRVLADQYVPVGAKVTIEMSGDKARVVQVNQLPGKFIPAFAEGHEEVEEEPIADSYVLYDHQAPDIDDEEKEACVEEEIIPDQEQAPVFGSPLSAEALQQMPAFTAEYADIGSVNGATLTSWIQRGGQPVAIIKSVDQVATRYKMSKKLHAGQRIQVRLERAIRDMRTGEVVGFISKGPEGLEIPIPAEELSISLRNPALRDLEGRAFQVTVISPDSSKGYPFVSLLPEAENDLVQLLNLQEVECPIIEISGKGVYLAIPGMGGINHCGYIPIKAISKMLSELAPGDKVIVEMKLRMSEQGNASVPLKVRSSLSEATVKELEERGIGVKDGRLSCTKPLPCNDVFSSRCSLPELAPDIRRLYAQSYELYITILETSKSREIFGILYQEACHIREKANVADPETTRDKIKDIRVRSKELFLSRRSIFSLQQVLDDAWSIQSIADAQAFIQRQRAFIQKKYNEIANLEERLLSTRRLEKISQVRGWINENKQKIQEAEQKIQGAKQSIRDEQQKLEEMRYRIKK